LCVISNLKHVNGACVVIAIGEVLMGESLLAY
jgi:hypothetical protein